MCPKERSEYQRNNEKHCTTISWFLNPTLNNLFTFMHFNEHLKLKGRPKGKLKLTMTCPVNYNIDNHNKTKQKCLLCKFTNW